MEKTQSKKPNSIKSTKTKELNKLKSTKTKELNKPKSIKNSKKILSSVINYNKLELYQIKFEEDELLLIDDNKIIEDNKLNNKQIIYLIRFFSILVLFF